MNIAILGVNAGIDISKFGKFLVTSGVSKKKLALQECLRVSLNLLGYIPLLGSWLNEKYRQRFFVGLARDYERGKISTPEFKIAMQEMFPEVQAFLNDAEFKESWNMMVKLTPQASAILNDVAQKIKLFPNTHIYLPITTNPLHREEMESQYGKKLPGIPCYSYEMQATNEALIRRVGQQIVSDHPNYSFSTKIPFLQLWGSKKFLKLSSPEKDSLNWTAVFGPQLCPPPKISIQPRTRVLISSTRVQVSASVQQIQRTTERNPRRTNRAG